MHFFVCCLEVSQILSSFSDMWITACKKISRRRTFLHNCVVYMLRVANNYKSRCLPAWLLHHLTLTVMNNLMSSSNSIVILQLIRGISLLQKYSLNIGTAKKKSNPKPPGRKPVWIHCLAAWHTARKGATCSCLESDQLHYSKHENVAVCAHLYTPRQASCRSCW